MVISFLAVSNHDTCIASSAFLKRKKHYTCMLISPGMTSYESLSSFLGCMTTLVRQFTHYSNRLFFACFVIPGTLYDPCVHAHLANACMQRVSSVKDAKGRPLVVFSVRRWPKGDQDWLRMVIDALEVCCEIFFVLNRDVFLVS